MKKIKNTPFSHSRLSVAVKRGLLGFALVGGSAGFAVIAEAQEEDGKRKEFRCRADLQNGGWDCSPIKVDKGPFPQSPRPLFKTEAYEQFKLKKKPAQDATELPDDETNTDQETVSEDADSLVSQDEDELGALSLLRTPSPGPTARLDRPLESKRSLKGASKPQRAFTFEELDWVPRAQLTEEQLRRCPLYCPGIYVEPQATEETRLDPEEAPLRAKAEQTQFAENGAYTFLGNVEINQGYRQAASDKVLYYRDEQQAVLEGNIKLREPGLLLRGETAQYNLETGEAVLEQATYVLHEDKLRGTADRIWQKDDGTLVVDNGSYTQCEPGSDSWSISSEELTLFPDKGYGVAKSARLKINDQTVLYTPFVRFPLDRERQSGFLVPAGGFTGEDGTDLAFPYYWNLAENYDATLTPRIIGKRGFLTEGELRYLDPRSEAEFGVAFLPSDDEFDGQDRWLWGLKQRGSYGRWSTRLDITKVSDDDYFRDLGTDLSFSSRTELEQLGEASYQAENWRFLGRIQSFQNLDQDVIDSYERIPQLDLEARIPSSRWPLNYLLESEYVFFDSDEDLRGNKRVKGHRIHAQPGLEVPLRWPFGFLKTTYKLKHTQYYLDNELENQSDDPSRTIPVFSVDGGLFFDRNVTIAGQSFLQTLEPRIYYLNSAFENQDDLPVFDSSRLTFGFNQLFREDRFSGRDRIGDSERVTFALTTRFIDQDDGLERFRASIGQIYYFDDRRVTLNGRPVIEDLENSSAIVTELSYRVGRSLRVFADLEWNPRDGRTDEGSFQLRYNPDVTRIFNVGYRVRRNPFRDTIEQSDVSFIWPIVENWSLIGRWNFNFRDHQTLEAFGGFEYNNCCLKVRMIYRRFINDPSERERVDFDDRRVENGVFFQLQLKGLAGIGGNVDSILEDGIIGYRAREEQDTLNPEKQRRR